MKLFACHRCQQLVFFESSSCTRCGHALAYLPDLAFVSALSEPDERGARRATSPAALGASYRTCRNGDEHHVCNWAIPIDDPVDYCASCRLNDVIPHIGGDRDREAWGRLESAKRRLLYTLHGLGLPVVGRAIDPQRGLAFAFLADGPMEQVFTGHQGGLVTINVAEADDLSRESARARFGEPHRTILGHFRHEIGHYYWERLVEGSDRWMAFRALFGDERDDYVSAQQRHYQQGPPPDWAAHFVSSYASMHPWEDWAECWAHLLHIADTLETARAHGLALTPRPTYGTSAAVTMSVRLLDLRSFDDLMTGWFPLTVTLNSLNRSMGLPDPYPFVLSAPTIDKLRFVHEVITAAAPSA